MIDKCCHWIIWLEPLFSFIGKLFSKSKFNSLVIFVVVVLELDLMCINFLEIIFRFFCSWCPQSFVVLDLEGLQILTFRPVFVLRNGKETLNNLVTFWNFQNRSDKLFEETIDVKQTWPEVVDEVDQQPFDMWSVMVLVSHNHDRSVTQTLSVIVFFAYLETHDLSQICNLFIILNLLHICLPDV